MVNKQSTTEHTHNMQKEYSDIELMEMYRAARKKGKDRDRENVFALIVGKYSRSLYYYLRRILVSHEDTDDVLQETFIKAWDHMDDIKDASALKNWLYRIANNNAISFLREKASEATVPLDDYDAVSDNTHAEDLEKMDSMSRLTLQAIHTLPKTQQMVFTMKHFQGLKYSQISEILGSSEGALKASYHIAVEKIKSYVEQKIEH